MQLAAPLRIQHISARSVKPLLSIGYRPSYRRGYGRGTIICRQSEGFAHAIPIEITINLEVPRVVLRGQGGRVDLYSYRSRVTSLKVQNIKQTHIDYYLVIIAVRQYMRIMYMYFENFNHKKNTNWTEWSQLAEAQEIEPPGKVKQCFQLYNIPPSIIQHCTPAFTKAHTGNFASNLRSVRWRQY